MCTFIIICYLDKSKWSKGDNNNLNKRKIKSLMNFKVLVQCVGERNFYKFLCSTENFCASDGWFCCENVFTSKFYEVL